MKLIDTHSHLQFEAYDKDRDEVVERNSKKLGAVINVGAKIYSSKAGVKLAQKVPNFYAAVGVHPHHVDEWEDTWKEKLKSLTKEKKVVAIGEVGLDNHLYDGYSKPNLKKQVKILTIQIEIARESNLPILFHCRKAYDDLYEVIRSYNRLNGLIHCYMGTQKQAEKFLALGLYISFSGNLTYKKNGYIRNVAKNILSDKILVETDAPYLPPEPYRGERNEPYKVELVAKTLGEVRNKSFEEISKITNENSQKLLNI